MDLIVILFAFLASGLLGFTVASILGGNSYERGFRDAWQRRWMATPGERLP